MIFTIVLRRKIAVLVLAAGLGLSGCTVPKLESPECEGAKGVAKEFYSFHFANDMKFSSENLAARSKFLTPELVKSVGSSQGEADVFTTGNTDYPKAFRIGACRLDEPSKATVDVVLFWKTDTRTEQKEIKIETEKRGEKWLIGKITN